MIGPGGAGKTRLSLEIGGALDLPVVHLDRHYWRPGWVETPKDEWRRRIESLIAEDRWVMDGNYGGTLDLRLPRAQAVVFLDLPPRSCVARLFRRRAQALFRTREDLPRGCPERLTWEFVKWVWEYPTRSRPEVLACLDTWRGGAVHRIRSRREVKRFARVLPERSRASEP